MKRIAVLIMAIASVVATYALEIKCVGSATQIENSGDTLFFFAQEIHLATANGRPANWYRTEDSSLVASNTQEIFPDNGSYYIEQNGQRAYCHAFLYSDFAPKNLTLSVEAKCEQTLVNLQGTIPEIRYTTADGKSKVCERTCTIGYTDLAWNGENGAWEDSVVEMSEQNLYIGTYTLPALCKATDIVFSFEPIAAALGLAEDSVFATLTNPIAVRAMPTSATTVRGAAGELSNEVNRPTTANITTGSAPLDILFQANGTPTVAYYEWRLYKANQLIVSRGDADTRYTFMEPGNYRAVCYVSNNDCPCPSNEQCDRDSTEITIAVSESMLRVPNVFTPNGDGKNDEFRVLYRSIKEYHIWVYNRWGKLVYESTDPAKGWDGTINNKPAAEGAYFYVIRALGTDASANADYKGKIAYNKAQREADPAMIGVYQLSGDINLLRGKQ